MKIIIHHHLINHCPVTNEDVNLSNRIFGSDISMMKGRSTCPKPVQVIDDYIETTKKITSINQLLDLDIDFMFINT